MESEMSIYYDEEGDFLEITMGDISNCYFDNAGEGVFNIVDKSTNEIKGIAVHSFKARTRALEEIRILFPFKLNISRLKQKQNAC